MSTAQPSIEPINIKFDPRLLWGLHYLDSEVPPVVHLTPKPPLIDGIPDGIVAIIAPVVAYWVFSMFFHLLDTFELAEKYRIHSNEAEKEENQATRIEVLREVLLQHVIQSIVAYIAYKYDPVPMTGFEHNEIWKLKRSIFKFLRSHNIDPERLAPIINNKTIPFFYKYGISAIKLFLGFLFIDTWQYWLHRLMHFNKTLYKYCHSIHHQLYVTYAYGALYNNPIEGLILDTLGTGIAMTITRLTPREQIILFTLATMKTVDDHCGYVLPFDPFQMFFANNAVYHDIHHRKWGLKTNFAQPFFTFWDTLFGTRNKAMVKELNLGKKIDIKEYKTFLDNREKERAERLKAFKASMEKKNE